MNRNKAYGMLGLAARAGKVASGEFSTEKAVKSGRANLVIVAGDASEYTRKMFQNMCAYYNVPMRAWITKEELGHAIGKEKRASLAVMDEGFAHALEKMLRQEEKDGGNEYGK